MSIPPAAMWTGFQPPPFTAAQWTELEHQALIFKYLKAGLTVPPDLLAPIHRSFQLMMPVPHSALGYSSYFGKKIDPEPGRCRRTDGKKWRCSRDAHPDSKYCERHMIRRRHRSRKPVETSQAAHPPSPPPPPAAQSPEVSGVGGNSFPSLPLHTNGTREGLNLGNSNVSQQIQIEPLPIELNKKEYSFGPQPEVDEHDFFQQKDMGNVRYLGFDSSSDTSMWSQLSHISPNAVTESSDSSVMANNCYQLQGMPVADAEQPAPASNNITNAVTSSRQLGFSGQLGSTGCLKQQDYHQSPPQTQINGWPWKYRPNKDANGNPDVNVDSRGSL
ncbi:hypothetical protein QN277_014405 [Acacia crassicarpa]|uniref:Growth-regulating factor n=1 Tax=Acacia crassicarpa TaxID=499986 RepID=A0AAE1IMP4_9FABA|nr:hypothetical protein QN277_014405 [Acacia crassicarpa]